MENSPNWSEHRALWGRCLDHVTISVGHSPPVSLSLISIGPVWYRSMQANNLSEFSVCMQQLGRIVEAPIRENDLIVRQIVIVCLKPSFLPTILAWFFFEITWRIRNVACNHNVKMYRNLPLSSGYFVCFTWDDGLGLVLVTCAEASILAREHPALATHFGKIPGCRWW